jgi:hypothetical protein
MFLLLIGILFYCEVISFKETTKYGKTAETCRASCAKGKQAYYLGNNYLNNSRHSLSVYIFIAAMCFDLLTGHHQAK